ncbi:MAG: hypothetical protein ACI9F9_000594 [Candidatus Paceibacteria bacterium]|jgi:hypothetical protein
MSFSLFSAALCVASVSLASPATSSSQELEYQKAPKVLGHDAPRVGEWVMDVAFESLDGSESSLAQAFGEKGLVIAMRDPECPLSKKYSPRLQSLEAAVHEMGLGFLYVGMDTLEAARKDVELYGLDADYAFDPEGLIASELDARTSTEVFVIDAGNTLVYRGMIDDQYGLGFSKVSAERYYLADALEAVRDGKQVAVPATTAQGCKLDLEAGKRKASPVTYHNRVSRIVQNRCQGCHRPGEAGPFDLMSYKQVKKRRSMIEWALEEHVMPPWFALEESGPWMNNTSLTESELEDFVSWIQDGAPEGEPTQAPLEREWTQGWKIGEPDLVVTFPEPFDIPADGVVDYQYFFAKTNLPEGKWVQAVEVRSGATEVVHHALVFLESPVDENGNARGREGFQTGGSTFFASAVPGQAGLVFPSGAGKYLPADSWIKFQMHYTPNGVAQSDQTSVGFIFSDEPLVEVHTNSAFNDRFTIPAQAFDYEITGDYRFPEAGSLLSFFPHTHLRGVSFACELIYPDGRHEPLLELPFYDFNWQLNYRLASPINVPAGTRLRATAWYDNSDQNPANPNPNVAVRFGEQTFEEMMISYVNWIPNSARVIEASSGPAADKR